MKRVPGKGVVQRWIVKHRDQHYLRDGNICSTRLGFEWVLDPTLATEFTEWRKVMAAIGDAADHNFKSRPIFTGTDPQGIQRNLDRCRVGADTREWLESTQTAETLQSPALPRVIKPTDWTGGKAHSEHNREYVAREVERIYQRGPQAKDVPTIAVLSAVKARQDEGRTWATLAEVERRLTLFEFPDKVVAAKCLRIQTKGLIRGASGHESRGEMELTDAGLRWIAEHPPLVPDWRCQRCGHCIFGNPRWCPNCQYTVYEPVGAYGKRLAD